MIPVLMRYSQSGLHLTEDFEQCRLSAYQDNGGVWTLGWGTTILPDGTRVCAGMTCTQAEADTWLMHGIHNAEQIVNLAVNQQLTQPEFDALVDFVYNCGGSNFYHSTMLRLLNAGDFAGAAAEFEKWDHVGATVCAGLLKRRLAEEKEFNAVDFWQGLRDTPGRS